MSFALALTGPTASGKTALSLSLAEKLGCEIISLDSMQIYKHMDIGTAKATADERARVPHHMIDFLSPSESYSAEDYRADAMRVLADVESRGRLPLFVGGTGLYLSTMIRPDVEEAPESDPEYRRNIEKDLDTKEKRTALWERLRQIDPLSAQTVHYNNTRRVIRALEIYDATGKTKSYFDALTKEKNKEISFTHITLDFHERENLYARINERVDAMLEKGLLEEVKSLYDDGLLGEQTTASQAIGYKEMLLVLQSEATLPEATEKLKQATRNYAKRQLTWFRNMEGSIPVFMDDESKAMRDGNEVFEECIRIFRNK